MLPLSSAGTRCEGAGAEMAHRRVAAVDLGAESVRVAPCRFDGRDVVIDDPIRFPTPTFSTGSVVHWDFARLASAVESALAALKSGGIESIGVDGWGVDYGLIDSRGDLVEPPRSYRTPGTEGTPELIDQVIGRDAVYGITGIQRMPINTLYQLAARRATDAFNRAARLVLVPDLLLWRLGAAIASEETIASTTQLVDASSGDWAQEILDALGLPRDLFAPIVPAGSHAEASHRGAPLIRVASHDTASAVLAAGTPTDGAYIVSGTWSLVGAELTRPLLTRGACARNFTNERGFGGTWRLLKNVMGLWLLQECRRGWGSPDYDALMREAAEAPRGGPLIDPDLPIFLGPGDVSARIAAVCRESGQREPQTPGETARTILESLACKYRVVLEELDKLVGHRETITVVGGGTSNGLLCQLTADVTGRPVITSEREASLLGNALAQLVALGDIDVRSVRELPARRPRHMYEPRGDRALDLYERYVALWSAPAGGPNEQEEETWLTAPPAPTSVS